MLMMCYYNSVFHHFMIISGWGWVWGGNRVDLELKHSLSLTYAVPDPNYMLCTIFIYLFFWLAEKKHANWPVFLKCCSKLIIY